MALEGALNGLQIASCIVRGDLDEICPGYRIKRQVGKALKKVKLDKLNLEKELSSLEKEVEYEVYRPFKNEPELALLYLKESPNCTELLEVLASKAPQVKKKALSMLLFVLENRACSSHLRGVSGKEGGMDLRVAKTALRTLSRVIDDVFINDDVMIHYALRLIFECIRRLDLGFLSQFLAGFNLFKYLNKCHVTTHPDVNFTILGAFSSCFNDPGGIGVQEWEDDWILRSLRRTLEAALNFIAAERGGPESRWEKVDLYYSNGKLKAAISVLLGLKGVSLQKDLIILLFHHFKHERHVTQVAVAHAMVGVFHATSGNRKVNEAAKSLAEYLATGINNCVLSLLKKIQALPAETSGTKRSSPEDAGGKADGSELESMADSVRNSFRDFLLVLTDNLRDDQIVPLLAKYDLRLVHRDLDALYKINRKVYRAYVEQTNVSTLGSSGSWVLVRVLTSYLDRAFPLPKYVTKQLMNAFLMCKDLHLLNEVFKLLVRVADLGGHDGVMPDLKTIINLNPSNLQPGEKRPLVLELEALGNWLQLLTRSNFGSLKGTYDPLKLLKMNLISENYSLLGRFLRSAIKWEDPKRDLAGDVEGEALVRDEELDMRVFLDLSLMKSVYYLGINDNLVVNKQYHKYLRLLMSRYVLVNSFLSSETKVSGDAIGSELSKTLKKKSLFRGYLEELRSDLSAIFSNVANVSLPCAEVGPDKTGSTTRPFSEMDLYLGGVKDTFTMNLMISFYVLVVTSNLKLLYANSEAAGSGKSDFTGGYKCLSCVLGGPFCGDILLKLLVEVLLQFSAGPENEDGPKGFRCSKCLLHSPSVVRLVNDKFVELQLSDQLVDFGEGGAPVVQGSEFLTRDTLDVFKRYAYGVFRGRLKGVDKGTRVKSQLTEVLGHLGLTSEVLKDSAKVSSEGATKLTESNRLGVHTCLVDLVHRALEERNVKDEMLEVLLKSSKRVLGKVNGALGTRASDGLLDYSFHYLLKAFCLDEALAGKVVKVLGASGGEYEDVGLLFNLLKKKYTTLSNGFLHVLAEGVSDAESRRKLVLPLLVVTSSPGVLDLVARKKQVCKLLFQSLKGLGNCAGSCTFFNCTLTLSYFLLNLLRLCLSHKGGDGEDGEEKMLKRKKREVGEVLYSDWFMGRCESFLGGTHVYLGCSIENRLSFATLKLLHLMLCMLDVGAAKKVPEELRKAGLERYYLLLKGRYRCSSSSEDRLTKGILFKILRLSSNTAKGSKVKAAQEGAEKDLKFYLKLPAPRDFKLVHCSPQLPESGFSPGGFEKGGVPKNELYNREVVPGDVEVLPGTEPEERLSSNDPEAITSFNKSDGHLALRELETHGFLNGWLHYNRAMVFKLVDSPTLNEVRLRVALFSGVPGPVTNEPENKGYVEMGQSSLTYEGVERGSVGYRGVEQVLELAPEFEEDDAYSNYYATLDSLAIASAGCVNQSLKGEDLLLAGVRSLGRTLESAQGDRDQALVLALVPRYYGYDLEYLLSYLYKHLLVRCCLGGGSPGGSAAAPLPQLGRKRYEFELVTLDPQASLKLILVKLLRDPAHPLLDKITKLFRSSKEHGSLRYMLVHLGERADSEEVIHMLALLNRVDLNRSLKEMAHEGKQFRRESRGLQVDRLALRAGLPLEESGQFDLLKTLKRTLLNSLVDPDVSLLELLKVLRNVAVANARIVPLLELPTYVETLGSTQVPRPELKLMAGLAAAIAHPRSHYH